MKGWVQSRWYTLQTSLRARERDKKKLIAFSFCISLRPSPPRPSYLRKYKGRLPYYPNRGSDESTTRELRGLSRRSCAFAHSSPLFPLLSTHVFPLMQTRHQPKSKMPIAPSEPGSSSQRQPAPDRFSLAALETVVDRIAERWRQENDDNDTLRTHFGTTWSIEVWAEDFKAASRGEHDNLTQQRKLWKEQKEEWRRRWLNRLNSLLESDHLSTDIYSSKFVSLLSFIFSSHAHSERHSLHLKD